MISVTGMTDIMIHRSSSCTKVQ